MTVSRKRRFVGFLINLITLDGLFIGNAILLITSGRTIGGLVAGYKYNHGGPLILVLWITLLLESILVICTIGIFIIVDWSTMGNRDGTFAEKWANNKKVNIR